MSMDFAGLTFAGLIAIGVVNVIGFFKPDMDSRIKFGISFIAAFAALFVPAELGNIILQKAIEAIKLAFAASGTYKLFQKMGGV